MRFKKLLFELEFENLINDALRKSLIRNHDLESVSMMRNDVMGRQTAGIKRAQSAIKTMLDICCIQDYAGYMLYTS